jgi:hypothetical protein
MKYIYSEPTMKAVHIKIESTEYRSARLQKIQECVGLFLLGFFGLLVITFSLTG